MKSSHCGAVVAGILACWVCGVSYAADTTEFVNSINEAFSGGKLLLQVRPRVELVDQDGKPENAQAFTVRTLLGWETKPYYGFSFTAQAINVTRIGEKDYNDDAAQAASSRFPLVTDPRNTDSNQLFLDYTELPKTRFRLGKQSIKLDNVRFIGNVEFRQVMQVFTGLSVENKSIANTELYFAHLVRVKDIFAKQREAKIEILRGVYRWTPNDLLVAYSYLQDDPQLAGAVAGVKELSNRIIGLRADGEHPFGEHFRLLYTAEYAKQNDYADGDSIINADYHHFGVGPKWGDWFIRLDYEKLGSNDGQYAFQTPLGTNHVFQGWADLFLTTPKQGIRDTFFVFGTKFGALQIGGEYHRYHSDVGGIKFGKELDLAVSYAFTKKLTAKVEYADFRESDVVAAQRRRDTTKIWFTLTYNH